MTGYSKHTLQIQFAFRGNPENTARKDDCLLEYASINVRLAKNKLNKVSTTNAKRRSIKSQYINRSVNEDKKAIYKVQSKATTRNR